MVASLVSPMWMLLSVYRARVGCILVEPPSVEEGGGVAAELAAADNWFFSAHTNNLELS